MENLLFSSQQKSAHFTPEKRAPQLYAHDTNILREFSANF
jgi:hypothetical protein